MENNKTRTLDRDRKVIAINDSFDHSGLTDDPLARFGDLLHRVALTVNSTLELKEVLTQLAGIAMEAIPADRCHFFLLDDTGTKLVPTFSLGRVTDLRLWKQFKKMAPIDLMQVPARWQAFYGARSIPITDMAASPLVPKEVVKVFGSRSALVTRLEADGLPLGIFSLDWVGETREFAYEEIQLIEAICAYAALAIRNARLYEKLQTKARTLERLVAVASALNSSPSLKSVLELICEAFTDLLATSHCSINTLDPAHPNTLRTLAATGDPWLTARPEGIRVSPKEVGRVNKLWQRSAERTEQAEPVVYPSWEEQEVVDRALVPAAVRSAALFPLMSAGKLHGFVLAGFPQTGDPAKESLEYGQALAEQAATAIARAELRNRLEQRLQKVEVAYRLSDVIAGSTDINSAIRRLNRVLKPEIGISLDSICIANAQVREAVGARAPTADEMEAIRSWRASLSKSRTAKPVPGKPGPAKPGKPKKINGRLLLPVVHKNRVQGALTVSTKTQARPGQSEGQNQRSEDEAAEAELLSVIASGCAEVIYKATLHRDIAESERRLLVAAERDRIARDLHDSVGQLLTGMGIHLSEYLDEAPNITWRRRLAELLEMSTKGRSEVRDAIHSLLFLDVRKQGLARSIRELTSKFLATTGIDSRFRAEGQARPLRAAQEDALFRVAHEGLMNVERHSRAEYVNILLSYRDDEVVIRVADDGAGLAHRDPFGSRGRHFGLTALKRLMQEVGGRLEVRNASPRGVVIEGRIPRDESRRVRSVKGGSGRRSR